MSKKKPKLTEFVDFIRQERSIEIKIANEPSVFVLRSVLYRLSGYFKAALASDRFREGKEGIICFPEDEPECWNVLLFWAVHRCLPNFFENCTVATATTELVVKCWIMGDKYGIPGFQNALVYELDNWMDTYNENSPLWHNPPFILAFNNTSSKSPFRMFVAEIVAWRTAQKNRSHELCEDEMLQELEKLPGALVEVVHAFNRICRHRTRPDPTRAEVDEGNAGEEDE